MAQPKKLSLDDFLQREDALIRSALAPVQFNAVASTIQNSEPDATRHRNMVREQKTAHFKAGHIGEKIHEGRESHLSDSNSKYDGDTDIVFDAGLGLALNNQMQVVAVSERGQAYQCGILEGDMLVGYDTTAKMFSTGAEVKQLVIARGGNISLHFNSMPTVKRRELPAVVEEAPVEKAPVEKQTVEVCGTKVPLIVVMVFGCFLMAVGASGAIVCGTGNCRE